MIPSRASRPGAGFIALVLALIGAAGFFAWGLQTPPLERIWRLQLELAQGIRGPLSDPEFALLDEALVRYPELAAEWLRGDAVRLLAADPAGRVESGQVWLLKAAGGEDTFLKITSDEQREGRVRIRMGPGDATATLGRGEVLRHLLPADPERARLVEVRLEGEGLIRVEAGPAR